MTTNPATRPSARSGAASRSAGPEREKPKKALLMLAMAASLALWPSTAWAELTVNMAVDRTQVAPDGRVVLQIEVSTDSLDGPEITVPALDDFEVVQQSVQRPMQFSFGLGGGRQVRSTVKYIFVLRPLRQGRIEIAPASAQIGGTLVSSRAVTVVVGGPAQGPQARGNASQPAGAAGETPSDPRAAQRSPTSTPGAGPEGKVTDHGDYVDAQQIDPEAFIRTVVDRAAPYEGQQVTVTIYLYSHKRLSTAPVVDQEPGTEGLWTHDLLEGQTLDQLRPQQIGRRRYHVYVLRRFAAFPLRPGPVTIGPMALTIERPANLFDMFGRSGGPKAPLKRAGVALPLNVKALPSQGRPQLQVAVGKFSIDATLDRRQAATGDAVRLTATLTGTGQLQNAKLTLPAVQGIEALEPQVRDLIEVDEGLLGGARVYEWLLVPNQPGTYRLPKLAMHSFDPETQRYARIEGPELSLVAAGQAIAANPSGSGATTPQPDRPQIGPHSNGDGERVAPPLVFGPIRTHSDLQRHQARLRDRAWYPIAVAFPVLALILVLGWDAVNRRRSSTPTDPRRVAAAASTRHLNAAASALDDQDDQDGQAFYAQVHDGLLKAMEAALGEPVGSCTRGELAVRAEAAGLDGAARNELMQLLDRCDAARFAPGKQSSADLQQALATARQLGNQLGQPQPHRVDRRAR